jgi:hypothetical protein
MAYGDPSTKDLSKKLDEIKKQFDDLKPKLATPKNIALAIGWTSIKDDLKEIKADIQQIKKRIGLQ